MSNQAYSQYRKTSVESIPPAKLLIMLYDGAIQFISQAEDSIIKQDINMAHEKIIKTQEILIELMSTLKMDYEVSKNLFELYDFYYNQLVEANIKKDIVILNQVKDALSELRDTWQQASQLANNANQCVSIVPSQATYSENKHFSFKG